MRDFALIFQESGLPQISCGSKPQIVVTRHPLLPVDGDRIHIGAGSVLRSSTLSSLRGVLDDSIAPAEGWVDEDILYINEKIMAWYIPPAVRPMHFKLSGSKPFSVRVFWPGLVLKHHIDNGFAVAAYAKPGKPSRSTLLYHAPIWNVDSMARLCLGSAKGAKTIDSKGRRAWEAAIFDSNFSHSNNKHCLRSLGRNDNNGYVRFIKNKAKTKQRFMAGDMVLLGKTVNTWVAP